MAYKGSFYYDEDYELGDESSFEYIYEDNLTSFDLNQVFNCCSMVCNQLTKQFLFILAINLAYRVIRQTGLFLINLSIYMHT